MDATVFLISAAIILTGAGGYWQHATRSTPPCFWSRPSSE